MGSRRYGGTESGAMPSTQSRKRSRPTEATSKRSSKANKKETFSIATPNPTLNNHEAADGENIEEDEEAEAEAEAEEAVTETASVSAGSAADDDDHGSDGEEDEEDDDGIDEAAEDEDDEAASSGDDDEEPTKKRGKFTKQEKRDKKFADTVLSLLTQAEEPRGKQKVSTVRDETIKKASEEALTRAAQRMLRKEKAEALSRSKRTTMDDPKRIEAERNLRKIATRGIVKLFNAIKAHQKEVTGGSDAKIITAPAKAKATQQKAFSQKLKESEAKADKTAEAIGQKLKKGWDVLQTSYMEKPTMKDWDQMDLEDDDED